MAETLVELVARIKTDATDLEKGLTDAERKTEASSKKMADSLKQVGMAMTASGIAITAALGLMGKAAIDEEINIKHLQIALKGVGVNYDSIKDSLESVITATQKKTGIADSEQRDTLSRLILVTKDYNKALKLLPLTLDLAAYSQMDTSSAATYLAKAYEELEAGAEKIGIRMGTTTVYFKDLNEVQRMVGGTAEAMQNPFSVLKATMSDLSEVIGTFLIPIIKGTIGKLVDIADKVQAWAKENPELVKTITFIAGAIGGILTVLGTWLLLIPKLKIAWLAFRAVFTASPIGLIITAIGLLVAAGIALWQNWDKVSDFFKTAWQNIKIFFLTGIEKILGGLVKFTSWIPGFGDKIRELHDKVARILESEQIKKDAAKIKKTVEELTSTIKAGFEKQTSDIQTAYNKQRNEAQKTYEAAIEAINKEYGVAESATKNKIELAKEATQKLKDQYDKEKDAAKELSNYRIDAFKHATEELKASYDREKDTAKERYDSEMQQVKDLYDARLLLIDKETDATVTALQKQLEAIDAQTEAEDLVLTRAEEKKRLQELRAAYFRNDSEEQHAEAKIKYEEYAAQVVRNELLRTRDAEKVTLRERLDAARENAQKLKDKIKEEENAALTSLKTKYVAEIEFFDQLKIKADSNLEDKLERINTEYKAQIRQYNELGKAADNNLEEELKRIEKDRIAKLELEELKLKVSLSRLDTEEKAEIEFMANQLIRTSEHIKEINTAYDSLQKRYDIEIVTHRIEEPSITIGGIPIKEGVTMGAYKGYASGGIVPGAIGQPQLAMVHGGETIIPANESEGNIVVNFTQPVFFDREDTMNRFVDMIRKGIQRQDRLRFGGAYSGS